MSSRSSSSSFNHQKYSHWKRGSRGSLQCTICDDNIWRNQKSANRHVHTDRHQKAIIRLEVHGREKSSGPNRVQSRDISPDASSSSASTKQQSSSDTKRALVPLTNVSQNAVHCSLDHIRDVYLHNREKEWFPWPDKMTCLLDIIRHLPSATLSKEKNSTIVWGFSMLSMAQIPSDSHMKLVTALLQNSYGTETILKKGALGNAYYINNILRIISQEIANPEVRPHLDFYPELTSGPIANANQACRWLWDLDADLTTPMIRHNGQDFYLFEPCLLSNGTYCMPIRWLRRSGILFGVLCELRCMKIDTGKAWIVYYDNQFEAQEDSFCASFSDLLDSYEQREVPDPRRIFGICENGETEIKPWTLTDPLFGNSWRVKGMGHRVLAFPIFLFCETSGNLSKGLNYNSFLFTAAGLSQEHMNHQYNVHFLGASPVADPLEMVEGIQSQIQEGQRDGVWAWDCVSNEVVLLIPSILALIGEDRVQSKFASLVNPDDGLFCRMCHVACRKNQRILPEEKVATETEGDGETRRQKAEAIIKQYRYHAAAFLTTAQPRSKVDTAMHVQDAFNAANAYGHNGLAKEIEMNFGIKDQFQDYFISKMLSFLDEMQGSDAEKLSSLCTFLTSLPENVLNPVWRIRGLDPHRHTPIEATDVVLLGIVKHFWVDAIALISNYDKEILSIRLQSFNPSGLEFGFLSGGRLIRDPGSLSKLDYKAIIQAAPFVLYNLVPDYIYDAWIALCHLVPLVLQPVIPDLEEYVKTLEATIHDFLALAMRYSLKWLDLSNFHTILHLPQNIRDFGPSSILSADKFDFYRSLIQKYSIDYSFEAPSRDIGRSFASANRIRHLLSGGKVLVDDKGRHDRPSTQGQVPQPQDFISSGRAVVDLWEHDSNLRRIFGYPQRNGDIKEEVTRLLHSTTNIPDPIRNWDQTLSSQVIIGATALKLRLLTKKIARCSSFVLKNGDRCMLGQWVMLSGSAHTLSIFKIVEILQVSGPNAQLSERPDAVLVSQFCVIDDNFAPYAMPRLSSTGVYDLVDPKQILCIANVQHNCWANTCRTNSNQGDLTLEGEHIRARLKGIRHTNSDDIILNCSQLRNHQSIHLFCHQKLKKFTFETAIRECVERREMFEDVPTHAIETQETESRVLESIPEVSESEQPSADPGGSFGEDSDGMENE